MECGSKLAALHTLREAGCASKNPRALRTSWPIAAQRRKWGFSLGKATHLLVTSAGLTLGPKISQSLCVFASLRLCVKDFDSMVTTLVGLRHPLTHETPAK